MKRWAVLMNITDWPRTGAGNPWAVYRGWRIELFQLAPGEVGVMIQERVQNASFPRGSEAAEWALDRVDQEMERTHHDTAAWARVELKRWAEERSERDAFERWVVDYLRGGEGA